MYFSLTNNILFSNNLSYRQTNHSQTNQGTSNTSKSWFKNDKFLPAGHKRRWICTNFNYNKLKILFTSTDLQPRIKQKHSNFYFMEPVTAAKQ